MLDPRNASAELVRVIHDEIGRAEERDYYATDEQVARDVAAAVLRELRSPTYRNIIPSSAIEPLSALADQIDAMPKERVR